MTAKLCTLVACIALPAWCFAEPATDGEEKAIRVLVEDLVFVHEKASETPLISPGIREKDDAEYKKQFEKCQRAYGKLKEFKERAFPILLDHLEDKRPSIHFKNHYLGHSVGDACDSVISSQLQDRPSNYSSYGYQRKGRDGKSHPKPYWDGTPFDEAGGVGGWLKANKHLSYPEMQVKCLQWLLDREKKIGAPDAASYFENILPLELRILERKKEAGADVPEELQRLRRVLNDKDESAVPPILLPDKAVETK